MRKFSLWVVLVLLLSIGSVIGIHWKTLQTFHDKEDQVHTIYQRQKVISSLIIDLERYRQASSIFRKMEPEQIANSKDRLKTSFANGVRRLESLNPQSNETALARTLETELEELFATISRFEPTLYSKDSYVKPEVQVLHTALLKTLGGLEKLTDQRIHASQEGLSQLESRSLILLGAVGALILTLILGVILNNYFTLQRPLQKLSQYADDLKASSRGVPKSMVHLSGLHGQIQSVLNQLAQSVEAHVRDRHKFILDVVSDLKGPLSMLQSGKTLLNSNTSESVSQEQQNLAAESVRRGMALFSGSLDDLNDIVDINRLDNRLDDKVVDLSETLFDVVKTVMGNDTSQRIVMSVPPIPLWVRLDSRRFQRVLVNVLSKVLETLPQKGKVQISISQTYQSADRGIEVSIQDLERTRNGRVIPAGPEQDILKHWVSENGLSLALAHKVIRAHGGSIVASGVAGMSVAITIRLPGERMVSSGLISRPSLDGEVQSESAAQGLVVQKTLLQDRIIETNH